MSAGLAIWRAVTKSSASLSVALFIVIATLALVYIITSSNYSLKAQWGQDKRLELAPASVLPRGSLP